MARKLLGLSFVTLGGLFLVVAPAALAQSTAWVIDSAHSTARLFAASSNRKDIINVAVARMSGGMQLNASNALPDSFTFEIYPADQYPRMAQPGGQGSAAPTASWWEATLIRFQSKSVEPVDENTVRVRGEMTATYLSRPVTWAGPSFRDYYGPKYGPPETHTDTQEVTFAFRKTGRLQGPVTADWSGATTVPSAAFPTLWNAVVTTTWPVYEAGGKTVATTPRTDVHCVMPATSASEGFTGEVCSGSALQILSEPDEDRAPGANRKGVADEVEIKLDMYLVKAD